MSRSDYFMFARFGNVDLIYGGLVEGPKLRRHVFCWLLGSLVPTPAPLSITVTGTHTYGTLLRVFYTLLSNFCSSTYHNPEIHFTLSTPSVYFSLLYFIPCEWMFEGYNQRSSKTQLYNYAVLVMGEGGGGCSELLSVLNLIPSHFTKVSFFYVQKGKPFLSASQLSYRYTIGCQTRSETFPPSCLSVLYS
jgi:hypothetical protein